MPYPPRIEAVGETYHVNGNATSGDKAFRDEEDYTTFLALFRRELVRSEWTCLAYTLMGTHYHLLVRPRNMTLSSGFQRLNAGYARTFNTKYGRRGAFWQRRFHDTLIESDAHLLEVTRYIALNAPRASLCQRAEDYPWCSYGAAIGTHPPDPLVDEDELLGLFGTTPARARERLRLFVEEGDRRRRRAMIPRRPSQRKLRDVSESAVAPEQRSDLVVEDAVRAQKRRAGR
jgi:putative transposase